MKKNKKPTISDYEFVKGIIGNGYFVSENPKEVSIRCWAYEDRVGMSDEIWESFKSKCQKHFGYRLLEFYHEVNYRHQDFVIYLHKSKQNPKQAMGLIKEQEADKQIKQNPFGG